MYLPILAAVTAALFLSGPSLAQDAAPLKTGVDGTVAPHAMPRMDGGVDLSPTTPRRSCWWG